MNSKGVRNDNYIKYINCHVRLRYIYTIKVISLKEAISVIADGFVSAIGHISTAEILTKLLGEKIEMNRIKFEQCTNSTALVFKLNGRPPEGVILTKEEIEKIGYKFQLLTRWPDNTFSEYVI